MRNLNFMSGKKLVGYSNGSITSTIEKWFLIRAVERAAGFLDEIE